LTISSWDNGTTYTIDYTTKEVRFSTGQILDLTADQTDLIYSQFLNVIATDPVQEDLGSLTYDDTATVCHPQCPVQYSLPKSKHGTAKMRGFASASQAGYQRFPSSSVQSGDLALDFSDNSITSELITPDAPLGDPCKDIVTSAALAHLNYGAHRTGFLEELYGIGVAEAANAAREWFPPGTVAAVELSTYLAEAAATSTQVNIMAFFWNSYNCGNRQIVSSTIYHKAPGGLGTGMFNNCFYEPAYISFDYGQTWTSVQVHICEESTQ
jgi:hypothetical protein